MSFWCCRLGDAGLGGRTGRTGPSGQAWAGRGGAMARGWAWRRLLAGETAPAFPAPAAFVVGHLNGPVVQQVPRWVLPRTRRLQPPGGAGRTAAFRVTAVEIYWGLKSGVLKNAS